MEVTDADATHDSIPSFTAARFVDRLYASLAWEATIQLGDAALSSRLVERVMRRAWDERERFATADALLKHARDAAREAIAREAERRRDVTTFDAGSSLAPPGDLQAMSADQVHRRLVEHSTSPDDPDAPRTAPRAPAPAWEESLVPPADPAPPATRPALHASTAQPASRPVAYAAQAQSAPAESVAAESVPAKSAPAPANTPMMPAFVARTPIEPAHHTTSQPLDLPPVRLRVPAATPPVATDTQRRIVLTPEPAVAASGVRPPVARQPAAARERPHLRAASYIVHDERLTFRPRVVGLAMAGIVLSAALAYRVFGGPAPDLVALAALEAPGGVLESTSHGEQRVVTLPGGSTARLGPDASVRASGTFADGARALTVAGPVKLSITEQDHSPVAVGTGTHRWVIAGGTVSFQPDGDLVLAKVDSGVVTYVGAEQRTPIESGRAVAVAADGAIVPLDGPAQDAPFAWQQGRLQLRDVSVLILRERVQQWFGFDLRFATPRASEELITLDVPLEPADSVLAALAALGDGAIERSGSIVTVGASTPRPSRGSVASRRSSAPTTRASIPQMPRIQPLPTIPQD